MPKSSTLWRCIPTTLSDDYSSSECKSTLQKRTWQSWLRYAERYATVFVALLSALAHRLRLILRYSSGHLRLAMVSLLGSLLLHILHT